MKMKKMKEEGYIVSESFVSDSQGHISDVVVQMEECSLNREDN